MQGGVGLIITNKQASRIITHSTDPMRRWVWVTLRGKRNEQLTIVCAYRTNPGGPSNRQTPVWLQQQQYLTKEAAKKHKSSMTPKKYVYWV